MNSSATWCFDSRIMNAVRPVGFVNSVVADFQGNPEPMAAGHFGRDLA
jgi:hypothetical protein